MSDDKPTWIFKEMIWPAVAGNVAWSFFTLAIAWGEWGEGKTWESAGVWCTRLVILGGLSIYVVLDYIATRGRSDRLPANFIFFDGLQSVGIIVYSLAVYANKPWSAAGLAGLFLVGAVGHYFRAWVDTTAPEQYPRWCLIGVNVLGLVLAGIAFCYRSLFWETIAVFAGIALWWIIRVPKAKHHQEVAPPGSDPDHEGEHAEVTGK